jgi:hypothetical protein
LSDLNVLKEVSRPAINMRKMSPISLRKLNTGVGVAGVGVTMANPWGPTKTPALISANTHGRWKRRKAAANKTLVSKIRKNGRSSIGAV